MADRYAPRRDYGIPPDPDPKSKGSVPGTSFDPDDNRDDREQGFSGVGNPTNPVKPRHIHPGESTADKDEDVDLKPIDESRVWGLNENAMPGHVTGHDPSTHGEEGGGELSKGDFPYTCPADSNGTDKPDVSLDEKQLGYEWGRRPPELTCCRWEDFAHNPGYKIEQPSDAANAISHNPGFDQTMHEYGQGKLHSGSKKGPVVTNQKQALAIAFSEKGKR